MSSSNNGVAPGVLCRILPNPLKGLAANSLVTVVKEHSPRTCCFRHLQRDTDLFLSFGRCWTVELLQHIAWLEPGSVIVAPERFLAPLYDGDGEDEMLRITGKPQSEQNTIGTTVKVNP